MGFSIADFAPTLMKAVVSAVPGGDLAMMAARSFGKAFGLPVGEVNVDDIKARLDDPEIQLKLKEADRLFQQDLLVHAREMRALEVREYQVWGEDLASVRQMITATHDTTSRNLAYGAGLVLIYIVTLIFFKGVPSDQTALFILGSVVTGCLGCLAVFTGALPPSMNPMVKK